MRLRVHEKKKMFTHTQCHKGLRTNQTKKTQLCSHSNKSAKLLVQVPCLVAAFVCRAILMARSNELAVISPKAGQPRLEEVVIVI